MRLIGVELTLPLLGKELIEQAGRRRTYMMRTLYASMLFMLSMMRFNLNFDGIGATADLGQGAPLFRDLVSIQLLGIFVFMPAMTCGVLTQEKERDSLGLLLITKLSPAVILLEKLLGRLIPMLTFLLLSLPLMAFAYSLGGVDFGELIGAAAILMASSVFVACLTLMCSAYCSTTVSAFFASYMVGVFAAFPLMSVTALIMSQARRTVTFNWLWFLVPAGLLFFGAMFFLVLARAFIVQRALIPPRNVLLEFFRGLDKFFTNLNEATTGGVILIRDKTKLPGDEPIAWRETHKKSLGTARYLIRVLVAIETPLAFILAIGLSFTMYEVRNLTNPLHAIVWGVATLLICAKATSLISGEKLHQTMDVLASTPLSGSRIFREEFRGVQRLFLVLLIPFATVLIVDIWWDRLLLTNEGWTRILGYVLSVGVYLPLLAWISFWIGLKLRSQMRAIFTSLLFAFSWLVLLPMLDGFTGWIQLRQHPYLCPTTLIQMNQYEQISFTTLLINFCVVGAMLYGIRTYCLQRADRLIGRM